MRTTISIPDDVNARLWVLRGRVSQVCTAALMAAVEDAENEVVERIEARKAREKAEEAEQA